VTTTSFDRTLDEFTARLDALAARATRTVAELRQVCQTILDDIQECKQHLDFAEVDAELARMDARDQLHTIEDQFETGMNRVLRRVENARDDSIAAVLRLSEGVETAAREVARRAGITYRTPG
jgi:hypothetical protein